ITGGGTIYTDMNGWQFSFIIKHSAQRIGFAAFTQPILDALSSIGVEAQLSGRNDLMIGGKKFSGNAQHIGKNALLHHGSILFDTDLEALVCALGVDDDKVVSKGIKSVRQRVTNVAEHLRKPMSSVQFRDVMLNHLLHDMDIYEPTLKDIVRAGEIKRSQFDSWEWNFGKNPKFNITKENRFAGGKLTVQSFVKNGFIVNIRFYGDFFATEGLKLLEESLIGCRYNENDIKNALEQAHADGCIYQITADEILSCII
ncbi:MAG: lipoate--protein ligase, partial [Christensenellales bacterium]